MAGCRNTFSTGSPSAGATIARHRYAWLVANVLTTVVRRSPHKARGIAVLAALVCVTSFGGRAFAQVTVDAVDFSGQGNFTVCETATVSVTVDTTVGAADSWLATEVLVLAHSPPAQRTAALWRGLRRTWWKARGQMSAGVT